MNKNFKFFAIFWAAAVAVFHIITFAVPRNLMGVDRFAAPVFWVAYALCLAAFIAQIVLGFFALRKDDKDKIFLRLPLLHVGFISIALSFVVSVVFLTIPVVPAWIGGVFASVFALCFLVAALKAVAVAQNVEAVGEKVEAKTSGIKALIANAEALVSYANSPETKDAAQKVYEALRYSDPMSVPELYDIEEEIVDEYTKLDTYVRVDDAENAGEVSQKILVLLKDRNAKCKSLKK